MNISLGEEYESTLVFDILAYKHKDYNGPFIFYIDIEEFLEKCYLYIKIDTLICTLLIWGAHPIKKSWVPPHVTEVHT